MPFRPDPQDQITFDEFEWTDEFLHKPDPEQAAIIKAAGDAVKERMAGGDVMGAIKAGLKILAPWITFLKG